MPELPQKGTSEERLNNREERFCLAFVKTADRYESFDIAKYEASTQDAKAAAVSRLLKRPRIKARIKVLEREYFEAIGVDRERVLGNVAEIAFDKAAQRPDRLRALELLGKAQDGMWVERHVTEDQATPLTSAQRKRYEDLARKENVRLAQEA